MTNPWDETWRYEGGEIIKSTSQPGYVPETAIGGGSVGLENASLSGDEGALRLAAAAPELYRALERAVEEAERPPRWIVDAGANAAETNNLMASVIRYDGEPPTVLEAEWLAAARAALAKARGEP